MLLTSLPAPRIASGRLRHQRYYTSRLKVFARKKMHGVEIENWLLSCYWEKLFSQYICSSSISTRNIRINSSWKGWGLYFETKIIHINEILIIKTQLSCHLKSKNLPCFILLSIQAQNSIHILNICSELNFCEHTVSFVLLYFQSL